MTAITSTAKDGHEEPGPRTITVHSSADGFAQEIAIGQHRLAADEPMSVGGTDSGPNPYALLVAALGACTRSTLHRWMQIVGKIRLVETPWLNHSWHATFYVTARGLTTSSIAYEDRTFQIDFDFIDHRLAVTSSDGAVGGFPLRQQSVA